MRDKRPAIAAKHKSGFPPHKGGLQAEGRFDFVFLEFTTYGWLRESYNPVKNAMCKRWDTPEELTHDWATTDDDTYEMVCHCGSPQCRKIITGQDWRRPDLQATYREYMSWYLQEKI